MKKEVKVVFSQKAEKVYLSLKSDSMLSKNSLFNEINQKISIIKEDFHYGNPIAKNLIPKEYLSDYGVTNLFRVELPGFWRMLYTLTNSENGTQTIAFILDIVDHKTYDKIFEYRKK